MFVLTFQFRKQNIGCIINKMAGNLKHFNYEEIQNNPTKMHRRKTIPEKRL